MIQIIVVLISVQLELSPAAPEPSILARMTLTYLLGVEHGLYLPLVEASKANEDKEKA
jgi:hypothetical protein